MKLSVNKLGAFIFYIMNDKLKIKIKVDITGPINWTKDLVIDYNADVDNAYDYYSRNLQPLSFAIRQIECAIDCLEALLNSMSTYEFKIIE